MIILPSVILSMPAGEDRDFMEQLYREHYRLMFATAWKYSDNKEAVEDIVSDGCLSLMRNLYTLRNLGDHKLKAYIVTTIRNTSFDYFEKQKTSRSVPLDDNEWIGQLTGKHDLERKVFLREELASVCEAIDMLSPNERQVMRMKFFMNLSDEEIAGRVGISVNSIRSYISRARKKLKAMIYGESVRCNLVACLGLLSRD